MVADSRAGIVTSDRRFYGVAIPLVAATFWLLPIRSSLWLDETGTYFIVKDGLGTAVRRSLEFGVTSPLYAVVAWLTTKFVPHSEVGLRFPSLIAAGVAVFLLFRLACRLFGEMAGWISSAVFVSVGLVAFAAGDARPPALALTFLLGSALLLCRWVDEGSAKHAVGWALLATLAVYFQYLFLLAVAAQIPYAYSRLRSRSSLRSFAFGFLIFCLALSPALPVLLSVLRRRSLLALPDPVVVGALFSAIIPWSILAGSTLGLVLGRLTAPLRTHPRQSAGEGQWLLVICWLVGPPILLFVSARFFGLKAFTGRYFVMVVPALSLGLGSLLSRIEPARARRIVVATVLAAGLVTGVTTKHLQPQLHYGPIQSLSGSPGVEWNWRHLATVVNQVGGSDQDVLMDAGFAEGNSIQWLRDPRKAEWLLAPSFFYPISGRLFPVPHEVDENTARYMEGLVRSRLLKDSSFVLVTRSPISPVRAWLQGRLGKDGPSSRTVWGTGGTWVVLFSTA